MAMVSSMPYLKRAMLKLTLFCMSFFCLTAIAHVDNKIQYGYCQYINDSWQLNISANINLSEDAIEALKNGIPLFFDYKIVFTNQQHFLSQKTFMVQFQLKYNHITQTYILTNLNQQREINYTTLNDALAYLSNASHYPLPKILNVNPSQIDTIKIRFQLNQEKLPFSIRVISLFSKEWQLNSNWWQCPIRL